MTATQFKPNSNLGQPSTEQELYRGFAKSQDLLDFVLRELLRDARTDGFRRGNIGFGGSAVAFLLFRQSASVERIRKPRIDGKRGVVIRDRPVEIAAPQANEAAVVQCEGIARVDADRRAIVRERTVELAFVAPRIAAADDRVAEARIELDGFAEVSDRETGLGSKRQ